MKIECIAALANLAVNDENEINHCEGRACPIIQVLKMAEGKASYSNRAIADIHLRI